MNDKPEMQQLNRIFRPRSVAIVGASPEVGTPRNSLVRVLLQTGYPGTLYLIHPRHKEVEGLACYADLAALPEVPDLALIMTPSNTVTGIIEQCGAKGIRAAIVFSSGFEEVEEGKALAAELRDTGNRHGVAILGANCIGAWSVREKAILTFSAAGLQLEGIQHAPVAIVSQSGALGGAMSYYLQTHDIGCAYFVSVGNETQLDILDYLGWVVEQDDVKTTILYIEGLNHGARLLPIAERARARGVQIVALKSGNSTLGQSATASHTGKIASAHAIYKDVFEQAGIIAVDSIAEVLAIIETLIFLPNPRITDDPLGGVSALSISGGACALLADHADQLGVPMSAFNPDTAKALQELFPAFGRSANPADMTGQVRSQPTLMDDSLALMSEDPRTEAFVMQFSSSGKRDLRTKGHIFKTAARDKHLPVIMSFAGELPTPQDRKDYRENGVLFCQDPSATIRTLGWLYQRERYARRSPIERRPVLAERLGPADWTETMGVMSECGIGVPSWRILAPGDDATDTCHALKYPLVVKALPSDADHKTELGLVKLRVSSPDDVNEHAAAFRNILRNQDAGILVQEMIGGGVEAVLSCLRNTDFGPVLSIGLGGMGIELFRDVAYLALPAGKGEVRRALKKLKLWTLMQGFRGAPAADVDALVSAAVKFGDSFIAMPDVAEFEINPLMVMPAGEGVIAVDALLSLGQRS